MRTQALSGNAFVYQPGPRILRQRHRGFGLLLGAMASLIVAIVILAMANASDSAPSIAPLPSTAKPQAWIDIVRPIRLFDLTAPEFAKASLVYTARRNQIGGGRQDILTFGAPNGPSYLRVQLYRVGSEPSPIVPLYVDFARAAAQADLSITRSLTPAELATRFGALEVADISLSGPASAGDDASGVPCLGFRGAALSGAFRILGFACGGAALPMSRPALACLLERLDLAEAGDDQALAAFFATSELRRDPACAGTQLRPTASRASWIDRNDAPPPLQGKKHL
jgi:hypothetical protein